MTTLPFVEGYPSEYNLLEEYASEDYDSEVYSNWTEAAPYSNLFESVYHDVLQDGLIDVEYVPAHAAPTIEAENAIEQTVVVEAAEADATMGSEIAVEEEEDRFVEGYPSEYNLLEDYSSEDYDSEVYSNWTEAAPYSNLFESVYYDVLPDVWIDEYMPAHAAPTIEAENAIEQSVVAAAVEADATLESEIAVEEEEDTMSEWYEEKDATLESEIAVEEEEDTMNEWYEEEDATLESEIAVEEEEDTMSEWYEGEDATLESEIAVEEEEDTTSEWYEREDATLESENAVEEEEDTMSEWYEEEASEDEAWVAGEKGLTIQDFAESNVPFEGETWIAGEDATIEDSVYTIGSILSF